MNERSLARFEAKVDRGGGLDACHRWWGSVSEGGYGLCRIEGVPRRAHRVAYEIAYGPIPEGLLVRHTCDNRRCVNPKHLIVGTIADNNRDRLRHGSSYFHGDQHWGSKLSETDIKFAFELRRTGTPYRDIAARLGISYTAIHYALNGKTWKHLDRPADLPRVFPPAHIADEVIEMAQRMRDEEHATWRQIEAATGYTRIHLMLRLPRRTGYNPNPVKLTPDEADEAIRLRLNGLSWTKLSRHFGNRISRMGLYYAWRDKMAWWREAEERVGVS